MHRATWKRKLKKIEGSKLKKIQVSEALETSQVKKIEGSFRQDPSVQSSIRKSFRMWISRNAQTNGGRQKRSRSSVARRNNDESRSVQRYSQVTTSATLAKLACVFCTSTSRLYITAPSPLLPRPIPRYASGAHQKRPQRNQMRRTLRRPPS